MLAGFTKHQLDLDGLQPGQNELSVLVAEFFVLFILVDAVENQLVALVHEIVDHVALALEFFEVIEIDGAAVELGVDFAVAAGEELNQTVAQVAAHAGAQDKGDHAQQEDGGHPEFLVFTKALERVESHDPSST